MCVCRAQDGFIAPKLLDTSIQAFSCVRNPVVWSLSWLSAITLHKIRTVLHFVCCLQEQLNHHWHDREIFLGFQRIPSKHFWHGFQDVVGGGVVSGVWNHETKLSKCTAAIFVFSPKLFLFSGNIWEVSMHEIFSEHSMSPVKQRRLSSPRPHGHHSGFE